MFIQGDVFEVDLPRHGYALVYADPPYAGCRFKYARRNGSRQWGINARADFMRELVARMESLRAADGACALSMATPELRLLHMFPTSARVCAWVKDWAQFRPGVWPTFSWEPVVLWGTLPHYKRDGTLKHIQRPGGVPFDWVNESPVPDRARDHETPKPWGFAEWVLDIGLGARRGHVLELFAGSQPICKAAGSRGLDATAVDLDDYRPPLLREATA